MSPETALAPDATTIRIIVLGGYGVFGGRLCQLLATDPRLALFVAGRSLERAEAFCLHLPRGAHRQALAFDRDKDLDEQIRLARPDLVIDATGPFQTYGKQPYRLVEACLAHGVHYMDFADGSDFLKGIEQFDQRARELNLFILSGVSSFPVLTAAVVRSLSSDLSRIVSIRGGIAPSPYAGVGVNVIRAISAYAGKPVSLVRHGHRAFGYALTETMRYTIAPPGYLPLDNIRFSLVDVPDLQILPELWPGLDDVWMGAGPVPEILHRMLNGLAWLVRLRILPSLSVLAPLFHRVINILRWGEHRGGMFVEVIGITKDDREMTRAWHLLAEGNDGPYIPCMALQAVIKRILAGNRPAAGARSAATDLELDDYRSLFEQRAIITGQRESPSGLSSCSLFQTLLGSAWNALPKPVQDMHVAKDDLHVSGLAKVERGKGLLARLIAAVVGFPASGRDIPVDVRISRTACAERWRRTFAGRSFSSTLFPGEGRDDLLLCERFGPLTFSVALVADEGKLHFVVRRWKLLGIPLPRAWGPGGDSFESSADGRFRFHVEIRHPLAGLIVRYSGWLVSDDADTSIEPRNRPLLSGQKQPFASLNSKEESGHSNEWRPPSVPGYRSRDAANIGAPSGPAP